MREWNEDYDENPDEFQEENPDEVLNEELQEEFPQEKILEERGIPREWWTESMWKIDNSEILEREIEGAEKLIEKDNVIENKLESG